MANVQHSALTGANLHEPKGIDVATTKKVYVANGAGSGSWVKLSPQSLYNLSTNGSAGQFVSVDGSGGFTLVSGAHGQTDFFNATPYSLAVVAGTPAKLALTTVAGGVPQNVTEGTNARLTYTGTDTLNLTVLYSVSVDQASGTNKDITLKMYKNGVLSNAQMIVSTRSGEKSVISGTTTVSSATNDYFEIYADVSANTTVRVYAFQLNALFAGS
jgi:hypothetical protein